MPKAQRFIYGNGTSTPPTAVELDKSLVRDLFFNVSPAKVKFQVRHSTIEHQHLHTLCLLLMIVWSLMIQPKSVEIVLASDNFSVTQKVVICHQICRVQFRAFLQISRHLQIVWQKWWHVKNFCFFRVDMKFIVIFWNIWVGTSFWWWTGCSASDGFNEAYSICTSYGENHLNSWKLWVCEAFLCWDNWGSCLISCCSMQHD